MGPSTSPRNAEPTASTEVTANWDSRLRFQMAPKDAATGNYNLGARLLNPEIAVSNAVSNAVWDVTPGETPASGTSIPATAAGSTSLLPIHT